MPGHYSPTPYGFYSSVPRPPGLQSPPPYRPASVYSSSGRSRDSSPLRPAKTTKGWFKFGASVVFLIILAQAVALIFFYDLPSKLCEYGKAVARMHKQQGMINDEARHLEGERHLLKQERERWEKAREDRVPQGAFWGSEPIPAWDCRAYGKREYSAMLENIPEDWTDVDACMNMPVEIKGVNIRRPDRCEHVGVPSRIRGVWVVNRGQTDCKPKHQGITDTGCTNQGSGTRRLEAWVVGINDRPEQDWRLLCDSTPMTWNHITYNSPTYCEPRLFGTKYAIWDIPDHNC